MLRLLIQYRFNSTLITSILKPLWESRPHPDIRACLIMILIQFLHESNLNNDQSIVWSILEEAAHDDYHPVIYALFGANEKGIYRSSRKLKTISNNLLQIFVKRIQMKILDHPTSLTSRSWAWSLLNNEYCEINFVIDKAQQLCIRFDNDANILWKEAFKKIISFYKLQK
jgi:ribosome-associated toxin RatA of RatAB toxin-antitoxin module